jgi:sugar transferase (PEP-CTERM/EpsH1 system associated)
MPAISEVSSQATSPSINSLTANAVDADAVNAPVASTLSGRRLRAIFLSQRVPYPPTRGDKIITWRMVEWLHRHHDVTCFAFSHDDQDAAGAADLRRMGVDIVAVPYCRPVAAIKGGLALGTRRPLTTALLSSSRLSAEVQRRMPGADLAVAFSSSMGAFLGPFPHVPRILHLCELDSDKWLQYSERTTGAMRWLYAREARLLLELERQLAREMDANLVCTPREQEIFDARIGSANCAVMPNGVDLEYFSPAGLDPQPGSIVFTGVMDYFPNVDGCSFFVKSVLPVVASRVPHARFTIVGANPTSDVRRLAADPRVTVTGRVPDTRTYLRRASVAIAPLRIARGIQNKVLEALASGVPVVGTTAATQGVGGTAGRDYLVAADAHAMADAVCDLLTNEQERIAQGRRGREFVEGRYSWARSLDIFDRVIAQVIAGAASTT